MPAAVFDHTREQPQRQPHGGEVVDAHQPLIVVQPIIRMLDGAADGAAGIIDQYVDVAVLGAQLRNQSVAGVRRRRCRRRSP